MAPSYIASEYVFYTSTNTVFPQVKCIFTVDNSKNKYKTRRDRAFPVAAATLWNRLPLDIRISHSIDTFKSRLKTIYSL